MLNTYCGNPCRAIFTSCIEHNSYSYIILVNIQLSSHRHLTTETLGLEIISLLGGICMCFCWAPVCVAIEICDPG